MKQPAAAREAFTLVEILVTVVIITSAAMFLLPGLAMCSRISQVAEGQAKVYLFAVSKLAELELEASAAETADDFPASDKGLVDKKNTQLRWFYTTQDYLEDPLLKQLQCDFEWPGRGDGEHYQLLTAFHFNAAE